MDIGVEDIMVNAKRMTMVAFCVDQPPTKTGEDLAKPRGGMRKEERMRQLSSAAGRSILPKYCPPQKRSDEIR